MRDWLLKKGITHIAIKSTCVYWKLVYNVLETSGIIIQNVNARQIKYVPGHKTDKKDNAWICKLLLAGLLKPNFILPKEQQKIRDLKRFLKKLYRRLRQEKIERVVY